MLLRVSSYIQWTTVLFVILCWLTDEWVCQGSKVSYQGYKLLSITTRTTNHIKALRSLEESNDKVDFWSIPGTPGGEAQLLVSARELEEVEEYLNEYDMAHTVTSENVDKLLYPENKSKRSFGGQDGDSAELNLNAFNPLQDINDWLRMMLEFCPSNLNCTLQSLGTTYENRSIYSFKIANNNPTRSRRRVIWIDATIHAREWIATATILQLINHVVRGTTDEAETFRNRYDWFFIPVVNPDGYAYSHEHDRLWRKNRSPNTHRTCHGTDLNRNFDYHWGTDGVSNYSCSSVFCGSSAASEEETQAVQKTLKEMGSTLVLYLTLHGYGNMILFPYGFRNDQEACVRSSNHRKLQEVADRTAVAIEEVYKTNWRRGSICEAIYPASGSSLEFATAKANVRYSYCFELRGGSFSPDESEIVKSFKETWTGVTTMAEVIGEIKRRNRLRRRQ